MPARPTGHDAHAKLSVPVPRDKAPTATSGPRQHFDATAAAVVVAPSLVPEVRDRLLARLHAMGIAPSRTVSHAARITQRTVQSVRRWFDPREPGLPDLASFVRLCIGLGCRADDLLGTEPAQAALGHLVQDTLVLADGLQALARSMAARGGIGTPMRIVGDEMAPHLREGDLVFVDTQVAALAGNGLYALEFDGRRLIRRVEQRIGDRLVLKCDNPAYADCELGTDVAQDGRLRVVGKVHAALELRPL